MFRCPIYREEEVLFFLSWREEDYPETRGITLGPRPILPLLIYNLFRFFFQSIAPFQCRKKTGFFTMSLFLP